MAGSIAKRKIELENLELYSQLVSPKGKLKENIKNLKTQLTGLI
jgi:hypothetical protein